MKIKFRLFWPSKNANWEKAFKSKETESLFKEYLNRIAHFSSCDVNCVSNTQSFPQKESRTQIWLCERSERNPCSSEELSNRLGKVLDSGISELQIMIGGPNGMSQKDLETIKPDFLWSFGPLILPHELAAVVAAEQLYRAWSILKHLPYHSGH